MRLVPLVSAASLGFVVVSSAAGQITDPLVTDRPSFSASVVTVPPGRFQLESGYAFSREEATVGSDVGEILARIGLISRWELRLAINSYSFSKDTSGTQSGFEDVYVGTKIEITHASSSFNLLRPGLALLAGTSIPTGNRGFSGEGVWPELGLILGWNLPRSFSVLSNLIVESVLIDGERFGQFSGSLLVNWAFAERWGVYLEYFGFASEGARGLEGSFLNSGFTLLASDDLQFDARAGIGPADPDVNYFIGFGFALRI